MIASAKEIDALNITLFNSCINFTNVDVCNYCTKIFVIVVNTCVCGRSVDNKALILSYPILSYPILFAGAVAPQAKIWDGGQSRPTFWGRQTLLLMYFTIPVTSATSERTFSALRRLENYLRNRNAPEQLPTNALSQIDYGHTRHCEDCLCQRTTQKAFWNFFHYSYFFVGVCVWLSGRRAPLHILKRSAA